MIEDSVVQQVREIREALAESYGFDIHAIVADLRKEDELGDWPVVRLKPRPKALSGGTEIQGDRAEDTSTPAVGLPLVR